MTTKSNRFTTAATVFIFCLCAVLGPQAPGSAIAAVTENPAPPTIITPSQAPRLPAAPEKLPDEIKNLCPTFTGAVLLQVEKAESQTRAMFKSTASPAEIAAYYKKELTQRGWTLFKEMGTENSARLILNKGSEQLGFSAIVHPSKTVTFFMSLR